VNHHTKPGDFNEVRGFKGGRDRIEVREKEQFKLDVGDVARRDQQQLLRPVMQDEGFNEISVLRDDHSSLAHGKRHDLGVGRAISVRQVQRVECVMALLTEP
jgi:hypothetical protein